MPGTKRKIYITKGVGEGRTAISAFDTALANADIADYNLIYLSSIIPAGSVVEIKKFKPKENEYGRRLYVVIARCDQNTAEKEAWAGLGWVQDKEGRGVIAEHMGEDKKTVLRLIRNSLIDMKKLRPHKWSKINYSTIGIRCKNRPVCAVVVAVFQSEKWDR